MIISPHAQGTLEWLCARAGVVTASEFDSILTPEFKPRSGEMVKTYLATKVAEKWSGSPMPSFKGIDMEFGNILEEEALPWFTLETGKEVQRVGLITTDDGKVGCSPDGLIDEHSGVEIKCPSMAIHVKHLLAGVLPKDYAAQVHGAMFVTGRPCWVFLSYRRHFPALLVTVQRDEEIQKKIAEAINPFLEQMDAAMKRMEEINGGPPRRKPVPTAQSQPEPEQFQEVVP